MNRLFTCLLLFSGIHTAAHAKEGGPQKLKVEQQSSEVRAVVTFPDGRKVALDQAPISWAGLFEVSPDNHWIVQTQKTGSGTNTIFIHKVELEAHRLKPGVEIGSKAWEFWSSTTRLPVADLYHQGLEFVRWDKAGKRVLFRLSAGSVNHNGRWVDDYPVWYDLNKGTFSGVKQ